MKYKTIAIMAALIFGLAASPVFSNGLAFGQQHVPTQNTNQTGTYFVELRDHISAPQTPQQEMFFDKITLLLDLIDSMCGDKVLVTVVANDTLRCMPTAAADYLINNGRVIAVLL